MKLILFVILFFSYFAGISQTQQEYTFTNLEIGGGKKYEISLKNGEIIAGEIIDLKNNCIVLKNHSGIQKVCANEVLDIKTKQYKEYAAIAAGLGLGYSGIGVNVDISPYKNIFVGVSVGNQIVVSSLSYAAHCKYYLKDNNASWRPRLSLSYGNAGAIYIEDGPLKGDYKYLGTLLGIGSIWQLGSSSSHGFEMDFLIRYAPKYIDDINSFKEAGYNFSEISKTPFLLSFGYRYIIKN